MFSISKRGSRHPLTFPAILTTASLCCLLMSPQIAAVPISTDPNGFSGFHWGIRLADNPELIEVESTEHIQAFEFKDRLPMIGNTVVESLRFVTYDRQFARVVIRYKGVTTHNQILHHLQSLFGPIDRAPGSMMRGLNQQFTWRGTETEVNLTYDSGRESGAIFIESRTLAPRFNDVLPEHAF
jgi:hypothetical protein